MKLNKEELKKQKTILRYGDIIEYGHFTRYVETVGKIYPLKWTIIFDDYNLFKRLLLSGANPNIDKSILQMICNKNRHEKNGDAFIITIAPYIQNINEIDEHNNTILDHIPKKCCEKCNIVIETLKRYGAKSGNIRIIDGRYETQLKLLEKIDAKLYEEFIENVATTKINMHPIEWIMQIENTKVFIELVKQGASIEYPLFDGETILQKIIKNSFGACKRISSFYRDIIRSIFIFVDVISAKDRDGNTLLHLFASCNCNFCNEYYDILMYKGADRDAKNNYGYTPRYIKNVAGKKASFDEYRFQEQLLFRCNLKMYEKYSTTKNFGNGEYPLRWAFARYEHIPIELLEGGANIHCKIFDISLWTLIIDEMIPEKGCAFKVSNSFDKIIEYVENYDEQNSNGDTILHLLAKCNCETCTKIYVYLIDTKNVNYGIKNKDGLSADDIKTEKENENDDENSCCICFDEDKNMVFGPCGHICTCLYCSAKVDICPICRIKIDQKIKVYY
jgi:hypothetical protein